MRLAARGARETASGAVAPVDDVEDARHLKRQAARIAREAAAVAVLVTGLAMLVRGLVGT